MKLAKYLIPLALLAAVSCKEDDDNYYKQFLPKTEEAVMPELTEASINGTSISEASTVAGVITDGKTGKPIAGVPVTDGYAFTTTDANGVYQLAAAARARKVYYTTPAAYKIALDSETGLPKFYSDGNMAGGGRYRFDFKLEPLDAEETDFTLLMVADPQCATMSDYTRYIGESLPDMRETMASYRNVYAITLGDIIFDSNDLWPKMKQCMSNFEPGGKSVPFFQCMGNHDHDATVSVSDDHETNFYNSSQNYIDYFGPYDYSFDRGDAHIVVMNNVYVTSVESSSHSNGSTWNYEGGFTESQLEWLRADLDLVKDKGNKLIVFCTHIPFRGAGSDGSSMSEDKGYAEVLGMLTDFREAHIMIGHTHYPQNYIHEDYVTKGGECVYEHVHGAVCGAWWSANSNVTGAPNGYSIYEVKGSGITNWWVKGTGKDIGYQMRVYNGNQLFSDAKGAAYGWQNASNLLASGCDAVGFEAAKDCLVAEVWDDDKANWKVELFASDGTTKLGDFVRVADSGVSNVAISTFWFFECGKNSSTYVGKAASHYWYCQPASALPGEETGWNYTGDSGWIVKATQTIPGSGQTNVYTQDRLTVDYSEF